MLILLAIGCGQAVDPGTHLLADRVPTQVDLATSGPRRIPRWQTIALEKRGKTWVGKLPYRDLRVPKNQRFPRGMAIEHTLATKLRGRRGTPGSWWVEEGHLYIRPAGGMRVPDKIRVRYGPAVEAFRELDPYEVDDPASFVQRRMEVGPHRYTGLFLPAPASIQWNLKLPADAKFSAEILAVDVPIVSSAAPDAQVMLVVEQEGRRLTSASCALGADGRCTLEADLASWEGEPVDVRVTTASQGDAWAVLMHQPMVYTPKANPRRVVTLFTDTFRADSLGVYGAGRATPNLDRLATTGAIFDQARSVASWTVPSVRAVRSGRQPEEWDEAQRLAEAFAAAGFHTAGLVNNAFTSTGDMQQGFADYRYELKSPASRQIDEALQVLDRYSDRDLFLTVQFMDTHLPYEEPEPFRSLYTDPDKPLIATDRRSVVLAAQSPRVRSYVRDRYDQNVQFIDHEVQRLLERLTPDDTVVLYADHGEEFWEHDGFEHGHALWDEVVRVPLIIAGPRAPAQRVQTPVSLLDVAPTILELAGLPPMPEMDGVSLVPLLEGDDELATQLAQRDQLIGRTLWDADAWGLLGGADKYVAQDGRFDHFDLAADPSERKPEPVDDKRADELRERMEAVYGRPFVRVLALRNPGRTVWERGRIEIELDQPVLAAWVGSRTPKVEPSIDGNKVVFQGRRLPGQIYLLPENGVEEVGQVAVRTRFGRDTVEQASWTSASGAPSLTIGKGNRRFALMIDTVPAPGNVEMPTTAEGLEEQLEALGYAE